MSAIDRYLAVHQLSCDVEMYGESLNGETVHCTCSRDLAVADLAALRAALKVCKRALDEASHGVFVLQSVKDALAAIDKLRL